MIHGSWELDGATLGYEWPRFGGLPEPVKQKLLSYTAETLPHIEINNTFMDDHVDCIEVTIDGIKLGLWWLGKEEIGAFYYQDDPKAKAMIVHLIKVESDSNEN